MSNEALKDLHTSIIDAIEGYETAIKDAEDEGLRSVFRQAADLHGAAHSEIHQELLSRGESADDDGSFMGTVHRSIISVRSAVVGLDRGSLGAFANGEQKIIEKYDAALSEQHDEATLAVLNRQKTALAEIAGRMKQMAALDKAERA